jgi:hypothetical protein
MSEKVVVIFIEGATEIEFYNELIKIMRNYCGGRLSCNVEIENAKSICRYRDKVLNIFERKIKPKHPDAQFYVALCYDQDVFELSQNPPVNWKKLKNSFLEKGAKEVCLVKAVNCIEDWFLHDKDGVLNFLNLPKTTKIVGNDGAEKLKNLFRKKNKLYIKGNQNVNFIRALNIETILSKICCDVKPLCKMLGVDCSSQKRCCKIKN